MIRDTAPPPLDKHSTLQHILHNGMFAAGLLVLCAIAAFTAANSSLQIGGVPLYEHYHHFWESILSLKFAQWSVDLSLHHWVNDGLMAIFFFVVGLEIKREIVVGELASFRKAILPAIAAVGGMLIPAAIYAVINLGGDGMHGWAIPMATDIAFAAGVLGLLGARVHPNLAVFLVALAIVDDLGAVLVIAIFYTATIQLVPLAIGVGLIMVSSLLSFFGVRSAVPYTVLFIIVWFAFLESGVHASIEGVLFALTVPVTARYDTPLFLERIRTLLGRFGEVEDHAHPRLVNARQQRLIRAIENECILVEAPLQRIENKLHPWCALLIMPIFALANAGVHLDFGAGLGALVTPVSLGIAGGLLLGKPIGIFLASYLAVKAGIAELPEGLNWPKLLGIAFLGGIGFTMSLFIAQLAFGGHGGEGAALVHLVEAKAGVMFTSMFAALAGVGILLYTSRRATA